MTAAYSPRADWDREDAALTLPMRPVLGPLVEGDLCDIRVGRRQCGSELGVREAVDVDGRHRILCALHAGVYFPVGARR